MYYIGFIFIFLTTSLFADLQEDLEQYLPAIIQPEGEFLRVEPFPDQGGSFINSVYLVTTTTGAELVLKIENPHWKDKKTLNEVISIKYLDAFTKIPVPHIVYFENDLDRSPFDAEYILMKRLEGTPLNHVIDAIYPDKDQYHALLSNLADVLVELKGITFQQLGNFKAQESLAIGGIVDFPSYEIDTPCSAFSEYAAHWLKYYCIEMRRLSQDNHRNKAYFDHYCPIFERWLDSWDFTFLDKPQDVFVYSHQDFVMKNILVQGTDVTAVLDWEWSGAALMEFEQKTGLDFLFTDEDKSLFSELLEKKGLHGFFDEPPIERQLFYRLMGNVYTLIASYEWIEGKLEHTAKFLDQKIEQRRIRATRDFDMQAYLEDVRVDLNTCIEKLEKIRNI